MTTTYIGNWFEWTGSTSTMKKYYYAGGNRVAMRVGSTTLYYLLGDHLGSTSVIANPSGGMAGMQYYEAWGETSYTSGTRPTNYQYTGQRHEQSVGGGIEGLYFYGARWLDVSLGRFLSADSIIPEATQGVQAWDRNAYANNNPVRYSDPTGHRISCGDGETGACGGEKVNDKTTGEKPPFDASIGENNTNEVNKDKEVNPSLLVLVPVGILLTVSSAVTEVALLYTEAVILPSVAITPPIGIIAELTITATGLALADINLAYWAYTARVANEPEKKQKLELLPFWGIK